MEGNPPNSQNQWRGNLVPPAAMSAETEKLFRKWLKIQITQFYWSMILKVVIFILVVGSLVFSTVTLAPLIQGQLGVLQQLQSSVNAINGQGTNSQEIMLNNFLQQLDDSRK